MCIQLYLCLYHYGHVFNNVTFSVGMCVNQETEHLKACVNVNVCVYVCVFLSHWGELVDSCSERAEVS